MATKTKEAVTPAVSEQNVDWGFVDPAKIIPITGRISVIPYQAKKTGQWQTLIATAPEDGSRGEALFIISSRKDGKGTSTRSTIKKLCYAEKASSSQAVAV